MSAGLEKDWGGRGEEGAGERESGEVSGNSLSHVIPTVTIDFGRNAGD